MISIPVNIAKGCPCRQSSIDVRIQKNPEGASQAASGIKTGDAAFVTEKEAAPWWEIDLGSESPLCAITVYNWDVTNVSYADAGRSRARFLQILGSTDGQAWTPLYDRLKSAERGTDFGGIANGPLCVTFGDGGAGPFRYVRITLGSGGVLQLDSVQIFSPRECESDQALSDFFLYANELNYSMARRLLDALITSAAVALPGLAAEAARLGIALRRYGRLFIAHELINAGRVAEAETLLTGLPVEGLATALTPPPAAAADTAAMAATTATTAATPATATSAIAGAVNDDFAGRMTLSIAPFATTADSATIADAMPPLFLPLNVAAGQKTDILPRDGTTGAANVVFQLAGTHACLQQQFVTTSGDELAHLAADILARYPLLEKVTAPLMFEETPVSGADGKTEAGRSFVLDLPSSFEEYSQTYIFQHHRMRIEANEAALAGEAGALQFSCTAPGSIDNAALATVNGLLAGKDDLVTVFHYKDVDPARHVPLQAGALQPYGVLLQLLHGTRVLAAGWCLQQGQDCFLMACASAALMADRPAGAAAISAADLRDILIYRLIEQLNRQGIARLHLGSAGFGYKIPFGAIEKPLYTCEFVRQDKDDLKTRVQHALAAGRRAGALEAELGRSLEPMLAGSFETDLDVDFDAIVENDVLGTNTNARRYQATIRDAFFILMRHVERKPDDVFVDVGCGKGKMLYYATHLGYTRCIGIEISAMLLNQAKINLERLQLPAAMELWQRDACQIPLEELARSDLFYLSNPFGPEIMKEFLRSLIESQKVRPRVLRLIYCVAICEAVFEPLGFVPVKVFEQDKDGWRFTRSVIFEYRPQSLAA